MIDVALYDPQRLSLKPSAGPSRKRPAPATLPPNARWLDHVTLSMAVHEDGALQRRLHLHLGHGRSRSRVLYDLTVAYAPPASAAEDGASWVVCRSFSDYAALQQRLLARLRPGHACQSECAWLYNVLKHHFPKKSLFCSACKVESRRKALLRLLSTLRASLVNRGNLGCAVLRDSVCQEFAAFLLGDLATDIESSGCSSVGSSPSGLASVASAPQLALASKRAIPKNESATSLVSFASEDDAGEDDASGNRDRDRDRDRSSSTCSSETLSALGGSRRHYRRGLSSTPTTMTPNACCCRHRHREQFCDDYALATPTHGAVAAGEHEQKTR